jgi:hypothetical protein
MIEITDHTGRKHFVATTAISDIREIAETASSGAGIRSHVRLHDGRVIQSRDDATELATAVNTRKTGRP